MSRPAAFTALLSGTGARLAEPKTIPAGGAICAVRPCGRLVSSNRPLASVVADFDLAQLRAELLAHRSDVERGAGGRLAVRQEQPPGEVNLRVRVDDGGW